MPRSTATRTLFALVAIAFFATPVVLIAAGVTAERFENRRLADTPRLSQRWEAFQQAAAYLTDRMPLRAQAVRANTRIWQDVFGAEPLYLRDSASPDEQALPFAGNIERYGRDVETDAGNPLRGPATARAGRGGWLYIPQEFSFACEQELPDRVLIERWGRLVDAIRADGHETAMFVVPHKASVYPEHLPDEYPYDHCALDAKRRLWRALERDGPAHGMRELRSELLQLKPDAGDDLFQRTDMHWTTLGALVLVDAALEAVGGDVRLALSEVVDRGSVTYTGDLSVVGGDPEEDGRAEYGIVREPGAERVPGRTLIVCDSFAYQWMRLFRPYFEHVRYVSWYEGAENIAAAIRRSDRVIVEADEVLLRAQAQSDEDVPAVTRLLSRP
jgi:alginate O-acetyltransferase complex protein AlgJ